MKLLEHFHELFASSDEWSEMVDLQNVAHQATGLEREAACHRIADLLEAYAYRMENSGLVRWLASSFTPDGLRADAAAWRTGQDPNASGLTKEI